LAPKPTNAVARRGSAGLLLSSNHASPRLTTPAAGSAAGLTGRHQTNGTPTPLARLGRSSPSRPQPAPCFFCEMEILLAQNATSSPPSNIRAFNNPQPCADDHRHQHRIISAASGLTSLRPTVTFPDGHQPPPKCHSLANMWLWMRFSSGRTNRGWRQSRI
jgi:hypothetical protein